MTNFERIKTIPLEKMAAIMDEYTFCECCTESKGIECDGKCKIHITEWLKQEVDDEEKYKDLINQAIDSVKQATKLYAMDLDIDMPVEKIHPFCSIRSQLEDLLKEEYE